MASWFLKPAPKRARRDKLRIGFVCGKEDGDLVAAPGLPERYRCADAEAPRKKKDRGPEAHSDVAIWWWVKTHYSESVEANLIRAPGEVTAERLAANDVNLLLGRGRRRGRFHGPSAGVGAAAVDEAVPRPVQPQPLRLVVVVGDLVAARARRVARHAALVEARVAVPVDFDALADEVGHRFLLQLLQRWLCPAVCSTLQRSATVRAS